MILEGVLLAIFNGTVVARFNDFNYDKLSLSFYFHFRDVGYGPSKKLVQLCCTVIMNHLGEAKNVL